MRSQCLEVMGQYDDLLKHHENDHSKVMGYGLVSHAMDAKHLIAAMNFLKNPTDMPENQQPGANKLQDLLNQISSGSAPPELEELLKTRLQQIVTHIVANKEKLGFSERDLLNKFTSSDKKSAVAASTPSSSINATTLPPLPPPPPEIGPPPLPPIHISSEPPRIPSESKPVANKGRALPPLPVSPQSTPPQPPVHRSSEGPSIPSSESKPVASKGRALPPLPVPPQQRNVGLLTGYHQTQHHVANKESTKATEPTKQVDAKREVTPPRKSGP